MRHDIIRPVRIDEIAPDFELPDLDGRLHRLGDYRERIVVLNFWSCDCPHAVRTDDLITAWRERWGEAVEVLLIASNANETPAAMAAAARARRLPMILVDRQHVVADLYAAQTTPEVYVIDRQGRLRYRGAVDDTSFAQRMPKSLFLEQAVAALLAGESPRVSETRSYGCAIVREALE
ncbi:MAG: redoxin domain-containing protein [Chloroflexota bacterium]